MTMPFPMIDPDDPAFKGKTWAEIEKALNERDAYQIAVAGYDIEFDEERGPTATNPCKPIYATFPWEEDFAPFEKPATCTQANWKHTCVKYTLGSQTATLTLSKGAANNSIDPAMLDALQDAILDLQGQKNVRVVIIKAEGKLFSSGFDRKYLEEETTLTDKQVTGTQLQFARILCYLQRLPQFTVALVQGSAMGAAVGLLCACDMVIAVKGAFFAMSEAKLGLVPAPSIPYIIRRITFIKNASQLLLAGLSLSAEMAKDYGIVSEVVEDEAGLETELKKLCGNMTLCAPGAVAATKEVVMNTFGVPPSSFMLNYVASVIADVRKGPEAKGGIEAIQSKKKPAWAEKPVAP